MPWPRPAGVTLGWLPAAATNASDPRALAARGWVPLGPAADNCTDRIVDCKDSPGLRVFLTPENPFQAPSVLCPGASANASSGAPPPPPLIRVFVGCSLAQGRNADCWWDVQRQAFAGPACVYDAAISCACNHLTDFSSTSAPTILVASASDMLAVTPAAIVTKLVPMTALLGSLLGLMHILAGLGLAWDARDRRKVCVNPTEPAALRRAARFQCCGAASRTCPPPHA